MYGSKACLCPQGIREDKLHVDTQEAALKLKVGLSVLKRICRQMGLARWPFRTRQSLRGVIEKTREYYRVQASAWPLVDSYSFWYT